MSNLPSGYNEPESLDHYLARMDDEMDAMRGLLLWALFHHQGGESVVGQPIRKALGIGQHDRLTDDQITAAKIAGYPVTHNAEITGSACGVRVD